MQKYKLPSEDYENLKHLFLIEFTIYNIYNKLTSLESENKKNTEEYNKYVNSLTYHMSLEDDFYKKYSDKPVKISEILFYLIGNEKNDFVFNLSSIMSDKIENLIRIRIVNRLEKIITFEEYLEDEELTEDDYACLNMIDAEIIENLDSEITEAEEVERKYFIETSIDYEIEKDILNTILRILNEYINDYRYQSIKDKLIKYKYLLSLTFKNIENDFIENNFEISESLYWTSKLKADGFGTDTTYFYESKHDYVEDIFVEFGNMLLDLFENCQENDINSYDLIISQIVIRAISIFSDKYTLQTYYDYLKETIKDRNILNSGFINLLDATFESYKIDRELPSIISLRI